MTDEATDATPDQIRAAEKRAAAQAAANGEVEAAPEAPKGRRSAAKNTASDDA